MIYELELYTSDMATKTEKIEVEGTGVSALDTSNGAMFMVLGKRGSVVYVTSFTRVKSMRLISKSKKRRNIHAIAGRPKEKANGG